jgi:FtsZ-binding cell division protein ZapB
MASPNERWLEQWARRWVNNATEAIRSQQQDIAELRDKVWGTADAAERELLEDLIEELEDAIAGIRQQHQRWQRRVKRHWHVKMEDLAA